MRIYKSIKHLKLIAAIFNRSVYIFASFSVGLMLSHFLIAYNNAENLAELSVIMFIAAIVFAVIESITTRGVTMFERINDALEDEIYG